MMALVTNVLFPASQTVTLLQILRPVQHVQKATMVTALQLVLLAQQSMLTASPAPMALHVPSVLLGKNW
jgi:hypothetical protein